MLSGASVVKSVGAHSLREVLREAGRLAGRQGLVNRIIHWSPHTENRCPACSSSCQLFATLLSVSEHPARHAAPRLKIPQFRLFEANKLIVLSKRSSNALNILFYVKMSFFIAKLNSSTQLTSF